MARETRKPLQTKKHLARIERERRQRRYILLGSGAVLILVILLVGYGLLDQTVIRARQPVAIVNGERVSTSLFQEQVRYGRYNLIRNAANTVQFMQLFGNDPTTTSSFIQQLQQIQFQLEGDGIGQEVIDQLVDNELIRQEAERRSITVTREEVNLAFQEAFGYFPDGTPTPSPTLETIPTPTLSALQETLTVKLPTPTPALTATATLTQGVDLPAPTLTSTLEALITSTVEITPTPEITATQPATPTATAAPTLTPTPYTQEGYEKLYKETISEFETNYGISEDALRYVIESGLYRDKVREAIVAEIPREQEQVWARHILVQDEETANQIYERLTQENENFAQLAAEFSTDTANKDDGGDLGWFVREDMDPAFAEGAFNLQPGEISQPVQSSSGYHIIQVLGRDTRPLDPSKFEQFQERKFQDWLEEQRENSEIEIKDYWRERAPTQPALPAEIEQIIQQGLASQSAPTVPQP